MKKPASLLLRQFGLILLLTLFSQACYGQTLYQRSSELLNAKALKVAPDDYSFVVLGDSRDGDKLFKKALALAKSFDPLFILHGGDYSTGGGEADTANFLSLVNQNVPDIPLFVVMGNHENSAVFRKEIGPLNFTLTSKRLGLNLIALNNADRSLRAPELDLLRAELASASGAVFVAMHIPPRTKRWRGHTFTEGAGVLQEILTNSGAQGVFFAHSHLFDRSEFGGVPAFITGGAGAKLAWFSLHGERVHHILVVRVENGKASYRMVPLA